MTVTTGSETALPGKWLYNASNEALARHLTSDSEDMPSSTTTYPGNIRKRHVKLKTIRIISTHAYYSSHLTVSTSILLRKSELLRLTKSYHFPYPALFLPHHPSDHLLIHNHSLPTHDRRRIITPTLTFWIMLTSRGKKRYPYRQEAFTRRDQPDP